MIRFDQFEHATLTDVGIRRSHNQDNHAVQVASDEEQWRQRGHLFLVADGMGAHAVGEKASELATRVIPHTYLKHAQQGPAAALRKAFIEANNSIHNYGMANREFKGTGTTGSALLLRPEGAWVGHVGDSRVYRIRNGAIEQLTYDHSMLWEYARIKRIDPDEVQEIPPNVIHRCLGPEPVVKVDLEGPHPLLNGDIFVLCSDGLSGPVKDREIGAVASLLPPAEACRFLVDLANLRGGPDNITVLIVRVKEGAESNGVAVPLSRTRSRMNPQLPWWVWPLMIGLVTSGAALYLAMNEWRGSVMMFCCGAAAIVTGLLGLGFHLWKHEEAEKEGEEEEPPKPRIHRRRLCNLDQPIIDQVLKDLALLQHWAQEQKVEADWSMARTHQSQGEALIGKGDLPGAFREFCRAMLPFTQAMSKVRNKEEVFKPTWDKKKEPPVEEGKKPGSPDSSGGFSTRKKETPAEEGKKPSSPDGSGGFSARKKETPPDNGKKQ